jgi:hypothetical protein
MSNSKTQSYFQQRVRTLLTHPAVEGKRIEDDLFLSDVADFLENVSTALKRQGADPKRLLPVHESPRIFGMRANCTQLL